SCDGRQPAGGDPVLRSSCLGWSARELRWSGRHSYGRQSVRGRSQSGPRPNVRSKDSDATSRRGGWYGQASPSSGVGGDCRQGRQFGIQPGHGDGGLITEVWVSRSRWCGADPVVDLGRIQPIRCGGGGGQVVVEQASQRGPPDLFVVVIGSQASRISAKQVMQAIAACTSGLDQVRLSQHV